MAHVRSGDFAAQFGECRAKLGELFEGGLADDGDGVVGRKVVAIVFEDYEVERVDDAIGGVARDDVDFMVLQGTVNEVEVHDAGLLVEVQAVTLAPALESVGALEKFEADAGAPLCSQRNNVRGALQVQTLGVVSANDHGESVFETERLGDREIETLGVELLDALVDRGGISGGRLVENSVEGRAGVFHVEIDFASLHGFVDEESTAEIGFAFDVDAGTRFD